MFIIYNLSGLLVGLAGVVAGILALVLSGGWMSVGLFVLAAVWFGLGVWWRRRPVGDEPPADVAWSDEPRRPAAKPVRRPYPAVFFIPLPWIAVPLACLAVPMLFVEWAARSRPHDPRDDRLEADERTLDAQLVGGDEELSRRILDVLQTFAVEEAGADAFHVFTRRRGDATLVLLKVPNLRRYADPARVQLLDAVADAVRSGPGTAAGPVYVGVKGRLTYGAVRRPAGDELGSAVNDRRLWDFYDLPGEGDAAVGDVEPADPAPEPGGVGADGRFPEDGFPGRTFPEDDGGDDGAADGGETPAPSPVAAGAATSASSVRPPASRSGRPVRTGPPGGDAAAGARTATYTVRRTNGFFEDADHAAGEAERLLGGEAGYVPGSLKIDLPGRAVTASLVPDSRAERTFGSNLFRAGLMVEEGPPAGPPAGARTVTWTVRDTTRRYEAAGVAAAVERSLGRWEGYVFGSAVVAPDGKTVTASFLPGGGDERHAGAGLIRAGLIVDTEPRLGPADPTAGEDADEPAAADPGDYAGPGRIPATDRPVTADTRLYPGMVVQAEWGSGWYPATVREVAGDDVRITWNGWGDRVEAVPRDRLALAPDTVPQPDPPPSADDSP